MIEPLKRVNKFKEIAISAANQSKRSTIPNIHEITKFSIARDYLLKNSITIIPSLTENTENIFSAFQKVDKNINSVSF